MLLKYLYNTWDKGQLKSSRSCLNSSDIILRFVNKMINYSQSCFERITNTNSYKMNQKSRFIKEHETCAKLRGCTILKKFETRARFPVDFIRLKADISSRETTLLNFFVSQVNSLYICYLILSVLSNQLLCDFILRYRCIFVINYPQ